MYKYSVVGSPGDAWFEHYITLLAVQKSKRGLVIFSHVTEMVERVYLCVGAWDPDRKESRYQETHHTYPTSGV